MICTGTPAVVGVDYDSDIFTSPSSSVTVKVGGNPVAATVNGAGPYTVSIDGTDIRCPGPIEVFYGKTRVYCAKISGC